MLYEDVDFKTLLDRYTNSRMAPFLTHTDGVRANLFSINLRQKMTPCYGKSAAFFTVNLDATHFPSNTAEVGPIYLKMGHIMRKPAFGIIWTTKAQISLRIHTVWSAHLLFAAWIVTRCYSSSLYNSIAIYTVSCGKRLIVTCTSW